MLGVRNWGEDGRGQRRRQERVTGGDRRWHPTTTHTPHTHHRHTHHRHTPNTHIPPPHIHRRGFEVTLELCKMVTWERGAGRRAGDRSVGLPSTLLCNFM